MKITFIKLFENKTSSKGKHLREEKNKVEEIKQKILSKKNNYVLKKNQIALFAIALMLITSGYLNYTNNLKIQMASLGDAKLVSANIVENENVEIAEETNKQEEPELKEEVLAEAEENVNITNESKVIKTASKQEEYFTKIKLDRDTMYSQMIETYQKILEDTNIQNDQKTVAAEEIKNINNRKNSILTIENLIKAKNINDVAVLINNEIIDVVVKGDDNLADEQVAQISNIVSRELQTDIENIHITMHE